MKTHSKLFALLMALVLVFSLAACGNDTEPVEDESESESSSQSSSESGQLVNTLTDDEIDAKFPKYTDQVAEMFERNDDTVGWLEVPGTDINDVVVCYTAENDNNNFYYRRNFEKEYSFNGIFYADFRTKFGDFTRDSLSKNICIYGHTVETNVDALVAQGTNGVMFAPLKFFTQEEFARKTPYIYFSTSEEDMVWEVFAVFFTTVELNYNAPNLPDDEFETIINEVQKRSLYTYDVDVTANDKVLTLSTCTYAVPGIGTVSYPNDYRFAVMAKLVDTKTATKDEAEFTVNESPVAP